MHIKKYYLANELNNASNYNSGILDANNNLVIYLLPNIDTNTTTQIVYFYPDFNFQRRVI